MPRRPDVLSNCLCDHRQKSSPENCSWKTTKTTTTDGRTATQKRVARGSTTSLEKFFNDLLFISLFYDPQDSPLNLCLLSFLSTLFFLFFFSASKRAVVKNLHSFSLFFILLFSMFTFFRLLIVINKITILSSKFRVWNWAEKVRNAISNLAKDDIKS